MRLAGKMLHEFCGGRDYMLALVLEISDRFCGHGLEIRAEDVTNPRM